MKKNLNRIIQSFGHIGLCLVCICITLPALLITQYTYPVQDDFHYAFYANELLQQGYNILQVSWIKMIDHYVNIRGCYSSAFFGYLFSGIIKCDIYKVRIFCFISCILFFLILYFFVYSVIYVVAEYEKKKVLFVYSMLVLCFTGIIYYTWNEAFYWFITSVQYLGLSTVILLGICLFIHALNKDSNILILITAMLGFIGSGAALNISAFGVILFLGVGLWGGLVLNKWKKGGIVVGVVLIGALINALCPKTAGTSYIKEGLFYYLMESIRYAISRLEMMIKNPVFIIAMLSLFLFLCTNERKKEKNYKFHMPILFAGLMFCAVVAVIFPTILGYHLSAEAYSIFCRSNFIG